MRLRLLLASAALPLALWAFLPMVSSGASPSSKLDQLNSKIQSTQGRIGSRKGTERVLTTQISAYSARINALQTKIGRLQRRQAGVESDLQAKQAELGRIQAELRSERRRLVRLRARFVEVYQADKPDVVTVILNSKGFADLLERGDFMQRVSDQDQKIVTLVRNAK